MMNEWYTQFHTFFIFSNIFKNPLGFQCYSIPMNFFFFFKILLSRNRTAQPQKFPGLQHKLERKFNQFFFVFFKFSLFFAIFISHFSRKIFHEQKISPRIETSMFSFPNSPSPNSKFQFHLLIRFIIFNIRSLNIQFSFSFSVCYFNLQLLDA